MNSGLGLHQLTFTVTPVTVQVFFIPQGRVYIFLKYHPVHFDLQDSLLRLFFNVGSLDKT